MHQRGKRADELIRALKTICTAEPIEFDSNYYRIPRSFIGQKPIEATSADLYGSQQGRGP
jgi:alkanesulfonate monooxygenase SsuD/methylene tetrahydromethanopterin reductase-like flavin-dependent oxidoreductase (luciferase family)